MKKGKLNLDKKTVAKLSEENLENVQGGKKVTKGLFCCTNITVEPTEPEVPTETAEAAPADWIVISCKG